MVLCHVEYSKMCLTLVFEHLDDETIDFKAFKRLYHLFQDDVSCDKSVDGKIRQTAPMDVEKVHSTIKAIVRDWSGEGADERKMSYDPILEQLDKVFDEKKKQNVKVSKKN